MKSTKVLYKFKDFMKKLSGPSCKCNFYNCEELARKFDKNYVKSLMYF